MVLWKKKKKEVEFKYERGFSPEWKGEGRLGIGRGIGYGYVIENGFACNRDRIVTSTVDLKDKASFKCKAREWALALTLGA